MLPPRQTDKVMENKQLIDNVEKTVAGLFKIGTANHEYVNCIYQDNARTVASREWRSVNGAVNNLTTNSTWLDYLLINPGPLGDLDLYMDGLSVTLYDADATNYITQCIVYAIDTNGGFTLKADTGAAWNKTTQGTHIYTFDPVNLSGYVAIIVMPYASITTLYKLKISATRLRTYYA